jgi:dTDP-4-dehydrorhamnose reductase
MAAALQQQFGQRTTPVVCIETEKLAFDPIADDHSCPIVIVDCGGQLAGQMLAFPIFQRLVDDCQAHHLPLLMLSDSRVFTLARNQRYREADVPAPNSIAGEQLLRYEQYLAAHCERHIILRTGSVLASTGSNMLVDLVRQLRRGGAIPAAAEWRLCPTSIADLARVIAAICDQVSCAAQCWGIYHYHSSDAATFYEFAEVVLAAASQFWHLSDNVQLQADAAAARGDVYPLLQCQKIRDTFGIQQLQWRKAIPDLLKQMQASEAT